MKKKILLAATFIALLSFGIITNQEPKYNATFTQQEKDRIQIRLFRVWNYFETSNLPHGDVRAAQGQLDSAWVEINGKLKIDSSTLKPSK